MSFIIVITVEGGGTAYWSGGDLCSGWSGDAALFASFDDADATIDLLKEARAIHDSARVVEWRELPDG